MTMITHSSHPEHPLILKEAGFVPENKVVCYGCGMPITEAEGTSSDFDIYSCTICENLVLHKGCAELYIQIIYLKHIQHPLTPQPRMQSVNSCKICGSKSKVFAYRCDPCNFDVCMPCAVFRYPENLLCLEEDVDVGNDVLCDVCFKPVTDSTIYTSISSSDTKFYLHKTCVGLPSKINHSSHPDCDLVPRLSLPSIKFCDLCLGKSNGYRCDRCIYNVCVNCAFKDSRVIHHEGHKQHSLALSYKKALFTCNACREKAEDYPYICSICDVWIHESCAFAPTTISATTYHNHPLDLIYSVPEMHLIYLRFCYVCEKLIHLRSWIYYCHKCTIFVHMRCATSPNAKSMIKKNEGDCTNNDPSLVQFPLPGEESLFDLLIRQFSRSFNEVSTTSSVVPADPAFLNGQHWSHTDHPLEQLHLSTFKEEDQENDDDERLIVCNGCIQPISDAYPSFYGCIQCRFFLHKFCASTLPQNLPTGVSSFHPQHSLLLQKKDKFYDVTRCGSCSLLTNGFYYHCETCDINLDIHCTFLPCSIKYEAHKSHSLVQCAASGSKCSISKMKITEGFQYGCETCSNFHIRKLCIFYPSRMRHRWDSHTITLRYPPFFYEGAFYCQICEEQLNNNRWLYHCDDCDQSFHSECLRPFHNVKAGQTIVVGIDNQKHTLTYVLKVLKKVDSAPYICKICGDAFNDHFMLECAGCGYLVCIKCCRNWQLQIE